MCPSKATNAFRAQKPIYLFSISSYPGAIHINSLDISFFHPKINFSNYDYLIITSKQASQALKQYDKDAYINKKALCVSLQSAQSFEALGGRILDIGEGYGKTLTKKIQSYPKEKKWLYLRASVVASDFVATCRKDGYDVDEVIVYESQCSSAIQSVSVEEYATLIFTSPSSVKCFLINNTIKSSHKVVVIGNTTAKALPKGTHYVLSNEKNIQNCIEIAKNL